MIRLSSIHRATALMSKTRGSERNSRRYRRTALGVGPSGVPRLHSKRPVIAPDYCTGWDVTQPMLQSGLTSSTSRRWDWVARGENMESGTEMGTNTWPTERRRYPRTFLG